MKADPCRRVNVWNVDGLAIGIVKQHSLVPQLHQATDSDHDPASADHRGPGGGYPGAMAATDSDPGGPGKQEAGCHGSQAQDNVDNSHSRSPSFCLGCPGNKKPRASRGGVAWSQATLACRNICQR